MTESPLLKNIEEEIESFDIDVRSQSNFAMLLFSTGKREGKQTISQWMEEQRKFEELLKSAPKSVGVLVQLHHAFIMMKESLLFKNIEEEIEGLDLDVCSQYGENNATKDKQRQKKQKGEETSLKKEKDLDWLKERKRKRVNKTNTKVICSHPSSSLAIIDIKEDTTEIHRLAFAI
ncbi:hypothetical protein ACROYT_G015187 [Oculina patagonica]